MKKIVLILIICIITAPTVFSSYQSSQRAKILSADTVGQNIVVIISGSDKKILLHYKGKCGNNMKAGQTATLNIQSDLDGYGDYIKGMGETCAIDQAEVITGKLEINETYYSRTNAIVTTEEGSRYYISFGPSCRALRNFRKRDIYVNKSGATLSVGDKIFLPDRIGKCSILYSDLRETSIPEKAPEQGDTLKPEKITGIKTALGSGEVNLSWKKGKDDSGIDHYVISYSRYHLTTSEYGIDGMPNRIKTKNTHYKISGLQNGQTYYFYVIAIDTSGNESGEWSDEVSATPRHTVVLKKSKEGEATSLQLKKTHESDRSFLFKWRRITGFRRQIITLEVDGERAFSYVNWSPSHIRIQKTSVRKGKTLKLTITSYDIKDRKYKEYIEFGF